MTVTYSPVEDLIIGDMRVTDPSIKMSYLIGAKREMDAMLGQVYQLPFDTDDLEPHSLAYLQDTSTKIASGRLITSMAIGGEDGQVNPYGRMLLREGLGQLQALASSQIVLEGIDRRDDRDDSRLPVIGNRDEESAIDMFENTVMRGGDYFWRPGAV